MSQKRHNADGAKRARPAASNGKKHHSNMKHHRRGISPMMITLGTLVVALVVVLCGVLFGGRNVPAMSTADTRAMNDPVIPLTPGDGGAQIPEAEQDAGAVFLTEAPVQQEATAAITAAPTAAPTEEPTPEPTPTAAPKPFTYLPVFKKADTTDRKIAITVDDCYQVENLRAIVKTAYDSGARLTLFPIGENVSKQGMQEILRNCVFQLGFEIENHTWSHSRVFKLPDLEMAAEIWKQAQAVNMALGANYQQHFFRLMGGDGASDQRTHNYLEQLGYKGIANWSLSGSDADLDWIKRDLSPGMIYLFHTTDEDTAKLKEFIPWVKAQGYEMVTLNELLGFEDNEVTEMKLTQMPEPQPYNIDYHTHRKGDYSWLILRMQDKLRALGYLEMDGSSTGYYGDQTAEAVSAYQKAQGLPVTGEADAETQKRLLAEKT